jgi:hypothetical protein
MSVELIVEVLKFAPADLNPTERLTLVTIAESCRAESRMTYYRDGWDANELARRVGVTPESLTKVFRSLARKGCEVRVAHAVKDGRPVFAFKGKQTSFRLPRFAPQSLDESPPLAGESLDEIPVSETKDWTSVRLSLDESPGNRPQRLDESPPLLLKELPSKIPQSLSPQDPPVEADEIERETFESSVIAEEPTPPRPEHRLIGKRGITGDVVDFICGWIESGFDVRGLGWWITADRNGTLDQHIADAVAAYAIDPYAPPRARSAPAGAEADRRLAGMSPADRRVAENAVLYAKYRDLEAGANAGSVFGAPLALEGDHRSRASTKERYAEPVPES